MTINKTTVPQRLLELWFPLTIVLVLVGGLFPHSHQRPQARLVAAETDISAFVTALNMFKADTGYFPKMSDGLDALIIKPREANDHWKGPYILRNKVPLDPWKHPYVYVYPGKHNPDSFDVYSLGTNGAGGTEAIGNWFNQTNAYWINPTNHSTP
jgi:general secretion pathway protein G